MSQKQDCQWLPLRAPMLAVLVAPLAAVVPASLYPRGEVAHLDELKAGLTRVDVRLDSGA